MSKMIFVTGFARGGTSWLRDCIAAHPDVAMIPHEMVLFRDFNGSREYVEKALDKAIADLKVEAPFYVNKAPANAPYLGQAARACPESKFIFIIRDPRDVFISHKRGTKKWMGGSNKTVKGCMKKIQSYYQGLVDAQGQPNVMVVRYEDLHQKFGPTMSEVFDHIGVACSSSILDSIYDQTNFSAQTSRRNNEESRDEAKRKGVIGDWAIHLDENERLWYQRSDFWKDCFEKHGYHWRLNTFENILDAMVEAGVHFLNEDELLKEYLHPQKANVVVQHDIDYLNKPWCGESVLRTAEIEGKLRAPAHYNFLPMDDSRYGRKGAATVPDLIRRVQELNPLAGIGLHVNACERFYRADAPCVGDRVKDLDKILVCLNEQIDAYSRSGITFRIATAHGYGRAKKLPNNRDTREITDELAQRGIRLFDTTIRNTLMYNASLHCALTDVGGVIKPKRIPGGRDLVDPGCYQALPAKGFLRYLTHPGNYHVDMPSTVSMRVERFGNGD